MIPQQTVDQILDAARIEDVIGEFVTLKRRGADYVACCPFHNEKTPSFHVSPTRGIFKCFGCGKAGSSISFLMEHEKLSYVESLRFLARKYHIEVQEEEETAEQIAFRQRRESLLLVNDFAQKFFVGQMSTPEGRSHGYAYCRSRGMTDEIIDRFGIGWAPMGRTALLDAAVQAGYKEDYLLEAGLLKQTEDGHVVDKFNERVMFPVWSLSGRVLGYSGRTLRTDDKVPKYMNSPETELYKKADVLFGIWLAKAEIARQDKCYLVEGNVDVVSLHQLGITNVVAPCGTALTQGQIRIIRKFTQNIALMFDGDKAGVHAAQKSIGMVLAEDMNVTVVPFPEGEDPDSFSRKQTLESMKAYMDSAETDFVTFLDSLATDADRRDPLRKANLINSIADTVALISDSVKRTVFVQSMEKLYGVDSKVISARINATRADLAEKDAQRLQRERRREEAQLPPQAEEAGQPAAPAEPAHGQAVPVSLEALEQNKTVARSERELLQFLLSYGHEVLDFEVDSEYYSGDEEDKPTVAEFIRDSFEADDAQMLNPAYQSVYAAYFAAHDEGLSQEDILHRLLNSQDQTVPFVMAELTMDRYRLTLKNLEESLTTTSSWLVTYVPKAILVYMDRKLEYRSGQLTKALSEAGEDLVPGILEELMSVGNLRKMIQTKIGRN